MIEEELYKRQRFLPLKKLNEVLIIGLGGVGMWVALNLALSGAKKLHLVDHDDIDMSNLNRTLFRQCDIGKKKVLAVLELILERRNCDVDIYPDKIEHIKDEAWGAVDTVIDCRDTSEALPESLTKKARISGGYDGSRISMHINPKPNTTWGTAERSAYTATPSWLVPPELIAGLITAYIVGMSPFNGEYIHTFNVQDLLKYSVDYNGMATRKLMPKEVM